jgi:hypothetical protein
MEPRPPEILYHTHINDHEYSLIANDEGIYLTASHLPREKIQLPLPKPGYYNTSTPTSTWDIRGETRLEFFERTTKPDTLDLEVTITTTSEYWYYGSLDDNWHPREPDIKKKKLTIHDHPDALTYHLDDILLRPT